MKIYVITLVESGVMTDQHIEVNTVLADGVLASWNIYGEGNDNIDVYFEAHDLELTDDNN